MNVQPRRLLPGTAHSGHCGWHYELDIVVLRRMDSFAHRRRDHVGVGVLRE